MQQSLKYALKAFLITLIKFYKLVISPFLGANCRYIPTCSDYAIQAIEQKGIIKGIYISFKRVLRCHPFGSSGYDPVRNKRRN